MSEAWKRYAAEVVKLHEIQAFIDEALARSSSPTILEAGCGSGTWFRYPHAARVVGIDISQEALDRNSRLSEKVLGDIETHDLSSVGADVVVCTFVLEHLLRPEQAITNLLASLAPRGVLVLVAPEPHSLPGLASKLLPHRAHVWFYRSMMGDVNAGKPGYAPFPAPSRFTGARRAVASQVAAAGDEILCSRAWRDYHTWIWSSRSRLFGVLVELAALASRALSLGRYDAMKSTYVLVARRSASSQ